MSLVHPVFSQCDIGSLREVHFVSFYQRYALNWEWIKAAQLSENA